MRTKNIYRLTATKKNGEEVVLYITSTHLGDVAVKAAKDYGYTGITIVQTSLSIHNHVETLLNELESEGEVS